jgi:IS30 family transposase
MDSKYRDILKDLPESSPRSCLDPVRVFIEELRRRGRTYREVVYILADHCDIRVSVSTVYRFLHNRVRTKQHPRSYHFAKLSEMTKGSTAVQSKATALMDSEKAGAASDQIQQRIASLKIRQTPTETMPKLFDYDPDQPLHLRKTGVSKKP